MAKETKEEKTNNSELPTINVGIVGHIDHGKTTLLQKISGKWTDTHSEELKRGITIKLGYVDITIYDDNGKFNKDGKGKALRHVSFIDSPGHEMLMATMLSGAAIIDAAILVVAANEGIKPQTKEHLIALQAKQIKNLIVVQNKIDLVDQKQAEKNYQDIKALLKGRFENVPIIPVSAQQNINIERIYQALAEIPVPQRNLEGKPIFVIARSFDINKPGTTPDKLKGSVLGGTLKQGILKVGDEIEIRPGLMIKEANQYHYRALKTKVKSLFKGSEKVSELTPGGSMSIETELDMSIAKNDSLSGCVASYAGSLPELSASIKVKYSLFPEVIGIGQEVKVEPIKVSEQLMLNINTSMTVGIVKRLGKNELELSLKIPVISFKGDNTCIARNVNGHWRLIGCGEIL